MSTTYTVVNSAAASKAENRISIDHLQSQAEAEAQRAREPGPAPTFAPLADSVGTRGVDGPAEGAAVMADVCSASVGVIVVVASFCLL
jgi:hypothetical protein